MYSKIMYIQLIVRSNYTSLGRLKLDTLCSCLFVFFFLHFLYIFLLVIKFVQRQIYLNWFDDICDASVKQTLSYSLSVWFTVCGLMFCLKRLQWKYENPTGKKHQPLLERGLWQRDIEGPVQLFLCKKFRILNLSFTFTAAELEPVQFPSKHWETGRIHSGHLASLSQDTAVYAAMLTLWKLYPVNATGQTYFKVILNCSTQTHIVNKFTKCLKF